MSILINAYSTIINPPSINFPCNNLNHRKLSNPELKEHLNGFMGYVLRSGDGQMNSQRYALYRHIERTKHHFNFTITEDNFNAFTNWGWQTNSIIFMPDGTIRNPDGDVLLYPDGKFNLDANIPYPNDALQRKAKTEQFLATLGLSTPSTLPPVVAESEVILRTPDEVVQRALALMLMGLQAENFYHEGKPISPMEFKERCPIGFAGLSNIEQNFIYSTQPAEQDIIDMYFRYEASLLLQWAINWQSELPFADTVCNVESLLKKGMQYDQYKTTNVTLRSINELLDTLDLHYRLHWIIRDHQLKDQQLPKNIWPSTVQERHYALNWLTNFENADWDDVDTPT